jgi:hypothetical protein
VQRRRIESNHDAVVMQRLARQQEEAHVRDQRGVATAECKERHALETEEQSQLKMLMVIVHTKRSHLRRAMRHDASPRKVFNRWTRKAGAIAEWVADSDCLSSAKAATLMSARGAPSSGAYEQQRQSPGGLNKQSSMLRAASFTGQLAATSAGDASRRWHPGLWVASLADPLEERTHQHTTACPYYSHRTVYNALFLSLRTSFGRSLHLSADLYVGPRQCNRGATTHAWPWSSARRAARCTVRSSEPSRRSAPSRA